jgi:hypothetical protein
MDEPPSSLSSGMSVCSRRCQEVVCMCIVRTSVLRDDGKPCTQVRCCTTQIHDHMHSRWAWGLSADGRFDLNTWWQVSCRVGKIICNTFLSELAMPYCHAGAMPVPCIRMQPSLQHTVRKVEEPRHTTACIYICHTLTNEHIPGVSSGINMPALAVHTPRSNQTRR